MVKKSSFDDFENFGFLSKIWFWGILSGHWTLGDSGNFIFFGFLSILVFLIFGVFGRSENFGGRLRRCACGCQYDVRILQSSLDLSMMAYIFSPPLAPLGKVMESQ